MTSEVMARLRTTEMVSLRTRVPPYLANGQKDLARDNAKKALEQLASDTQRAARP